MYFNLLIGIVVIAMVGVLLNDVIKRLRSPKTILREELEHKRERQQRAQDASLRMRSQVADRMHKVKAAVREMLASLPQHKQFAFEEGESSMLLIFKSANVRVSYKVSDFSKKEEDEYDDPMASYACFLIERQDIDGRVVDLREAVTNEEAIRLIAQEIAELVQ